MMEPPPAATFEMIEAEFVLELSVVSRLMWKMPMGMLPGPGLQ